MPKLKMKKYIYPLIIVSLFLVGFSNLAVASWYNPFSWFEKELNLGAPSTELIYQKTILPITDSVYDLGTTTKAWRNAYIDQVCLTGDTCQTSWPTVALSGGSANLLTYWTSATEVGATSSPTVGYITATSTTATSSLPNIDSNVFSLSKYFDFLGTTLNTAVNAGVVRLQAVTANGITRIININETGVQKVVNQDNVFVVKNVSGGTLTAGQVVYVNGSTGAIPNVTLAKADAIATASPTVGIVMASIANNGFGEIMLNGVIDNINTSAFTAGDNIFVSTTTAGALTNLRATYPNYTKGIGIVLNSGVGNGSILVNVAPFLGGIESGTTADNYVFGGNVGIGTTSPYAKLSVVGETVAEKFTATSTTATSTFANGLELTGGCFKIGGSCLTTSAGTVTSIATTFPVLGGTITTTGTLSFGGLSTSTAAVVGNIPYFSGVNTFANVATTTLTASSPLSLSQPISVIGSSASALTISTAGDWTGTIDGNNFAGGAIGAGELIYGGSAGSFSELALGTAGYVLASSGGIPAWVATTSIPMAGDVTGTLSATVVGNDSHNHTSTTISGIDISADTNLAVTAPVTLTGDTLSLGNVTMYPAFTYATSSASFTGTTTIPLGVAMVAETWNSVSCFTDTGTVWLAFDDGTNVMNYLQASTTVGVFTLSTNNSFSISEKRYVKFGNANSSPTKISCTVSKTLSIN